MTVDDKFSMTPHWLRKRLPPTSAGRTAEHVYGVLHSFTAGHDRTCFPSHRTIAERARVSVATVKRSLDLLADAGAVTWEPRFKDAPKRFHEDGTEKALERTSSLYTIHRTPSSSMSYPLAHPRANPQVIDELRSRPIDQDPLIKTVHNRRKQVSTPSAPNRRFYESLMRFEADDEIVALSKNARTGIANLAANLGLSLEAFEDGVRTALDADSPAQFRQAMCDAFGVGENEYWMEQRLELAPPPQRTPPSIDEFDDWMPERDIIVPPPDPTEATRANAAVHEHTWMPDVIDVTGVDVQRASIRHEPVTPPAGRHDSSGQFHPAICGCDDCRGTNDIVVDAATDEPARKVVER